MADITYPTALKTDYEKLGAVYSLIEQMRLEHNRQGAKARDNREKYEINWSAYTKEFKKKISPLLLEQNRLKGIIRRNAYSKDEWKQLDEDAEGLANLALFGDKVLERSKPTKATSNLLTELKAIRLDELVGDVPPDPLEDFTTFTEVDENGDIAITANKIDVLDMNTDAISYVWKDYGVDHFTGTWEHLLKVVWTAADQYALCGVWGVHASYGTYQDLKSFEGIGIYLYRPGTYNISIRDYGNNTTDTYSAGGYGTWYLKFARDGANLVSCYIYSDEARTNLLDTLSDTLAGDFRYGCAATSRDNPGYYYEISCSVEDLDLQEAGETEKISSDSGAGEDTVVAGNPAVMAAGTEAGLGVETETVYQAGEIEGADSGEGAEDAFLQGAIAPAGDSGSGVESSALETGDVVSKVGSDTGNGVDIAEKTIFWTVSDSGAGIEESIVSPVFFAGDTGLGVELSALIKDAFGSDAGNGEDVLKALVGTGGKSPDMRLHGRTGKTGIPSRKTGIPSKGVNI